MNKDFIAKRLEEIEKGIQQVVASHHALQGAKNELNYMLQSIEQNESKDEPSSAPELVEPQAE